MSQSETQAQPKLIQGTGDSQGPMGLQSCLEQDSNASWLDTTYC